MKIIVSVLSERLSLRLGGNILTQWGEHLKFTNSNTTVMIVVTDDDKNP